MVTFNFADGSRQVLRPAPEFFVEPKGKPRKNKYGKKHPNDMTVHEKCQDIMHDLGGINYTLETK